MGTTALKISDDFGTQFVPGESEEILPRPKLPEPRPEETDVIPVAGSSQQSGVVPHGLVPTPISNVASFTALQEWDGFVVSVDDTSFHARLTDLSAQGPKDGEEVEIALEEVDAETAARLQPGALFRWSIGYERTTAGQKTRVSRIIVRLLPRWRRSQLQSAERISKEMVESIAWR